MNTAIIHETVFDEIIGTLINGVDAANLAKTSNGKPIGKYSSITKAASELTLVTPVLCSTAVKPETAMLCTRAIERKNVALYQMLFTAYNITDSEDALTYLKQFHTNLDWDRMTLDNFIDTMDALQESAQYSYVAQQVINSIHEQYVTNMNAIPESNISETSIQQFKEAPVGFGGKMKLITVQEADNDADIGQLLKNLASNLGASNDANIFARYRDNGTIDVYEPVQGPDGSVWHSVSRTLRFGDPGYNDAAQFIGSLGQANDRRKNREIEFAKGATNAYLKQAEIDSQKERDAAKLGFDREKWEKDYNYRKERDRIGDEREDRRDAMRRAQMMQQANAQRNQQIQTMLLPSDVRKANEMQPSLMVVNFYCNNEAKDLNIAQQFVCGVKAKLYPVDPEMVMTKIFTKNVNNNILLSLIKVSTGEISFGKDFMFAVDNAKLDAIAKSKRKSGADVFRALEHRSIKSKLRKALRLNNYYKSLATLVITQEEVEQLKKYDNVDVMDPRVMAPIMDQLCLLYFIVVDETAETIHMLVSGCSQYEMYTFSALDKEGGDSNYKKIVNLMTRVAR